MYFDIPCPIPISSLFILFYFIDYQCQYAQKSMIYLILFCWLFEINGKFPQIMKTSFGSGLNGLNATLIASTQPFTYILNAMIIIGLLCPSFPYFHPILVTYSTLTNMHTHDLIDLQIIHASFYLYKIDFVEILRYIYLKTKSIIN